VFKQKVRAVKIKQEEQYRMKREANCIAISISQYLLLLHQWRRRPEAAQQWV
jgi:hypothetical protein